MTLASANSTRSSSSRRLVLLVVVLYLLALAAVTLTSQVASYGTRNNFIPLHTIRDELTSSVSLRVALRQLLGNAALLFPLGLLLPFAWNKAKSWTIDLAVVLDATMAIETLQGTVVAGRSFDVDDIILNFLGGAMGCLAAQLGRRLGIGRRPT